MTDDTPNSERVKRTDVGASVQARLKRGSGTRDEDQITIKVKGETAAEAAAEFEYLLEKYETEYSDRCRDIQPDEPDEEEAQV